MYRACVVALLMIGSGALAQPPRQATPNDTLKSTEVLLDYRVVFRIYAPKASAVTLTGDFVTRASLPSKHLLPKMDSNYILRRRNILAT